MQIKSKWSAQRPPASVSNIKSRIGIPDRMGVKWIFYFLSIPIEHLWNPKVYFESTTSEGETTIFDRETALIKNTGYVLARKSFYYVGFCQIEAGLKIDCIASMIKLYFYMNLIFLSNRILNPDLRRNFIRMMLIHATFKEYHMIKMSNYRYQKF